MIPLLQRRFIGSTHLTWVAARQISVERDSSSQFPRFRFWRPRAEILPAARWTHGLWLHPSLASTEIEESAAGEQSRWSKTCVTKDWIRGAITWWPEIKWSKVYLFTMLFQRFQRFPIVSKSWFWSIKVIETSSCSCIEASRKEVSERSAAWKQHHNAFKIKTGISMLVLCPRFRIDFMQ